MILDSNYYHKPMRKLQDSGRRGSPDIVQVCMLNALDSPLNREGLLKLYVHTRNDEVIDVDPETRIPRSYNRFIGLMEQLFLTGGVPPEKPLMTLKDAGLADRVEEIGPKRTIALAREGKKIVRKKLFRGLKRGDDHCAIVGGFPRGDFLSDVGSISDDVIRIYPETLEAVTAAIHMIQFYEEEYPSYLIFSRSRP